MSDFEDEMDVDVPVSKDITFSSEATKGKRSAANLPVEAEDSLPWVEKYRPATLADVSGHHDILATINKFVDKNRLPHLLLYGPPGTGKTSTILALARRIYGPENVRQMVLELNASDDRGIDVVREQIKTFASTKQIFTSARSGGGGGSSSGAAGYKLIVLDEADAMTNTAQMALRRIMEKYTANTRFCIIANYAHKLSPALLSRCTRFRFSPLKEADIRVLVDRVVDEEAVRIRPDATDALVRLAKGDMRRALNVLQACHASSTPLRGPGEPKVPDAQIVRDLITTETIYQCIAAPPPDAQIFTSARSGSGGGSSSGAAGYKLIVLDEADAMTNTAQMALRRIMEKYTANTRFCIIANYAHKLSPALLSRCTRFRFSPLREADIRVLVDRVVDDEGVRIRPDATDALVRLAKGDMRRALNVLQACHASSTPLRGPGEPKVPDAQIVRDLITTETIYQCIAAPPPDAVQEILQALLSTADVTSCLSTINSLKVARGLALADIITSLSEEIYKLEVKPEVMISWLDGLADIEHRVAGGAGEAVQTGAVVGVVRSGVELMNT
ncbi:hypothetical protein BN1723_010152, partial [Verticillium longisporum]